MKEKILDAFKTLGFVLEELEGIGYAFEYEGTRCLYMYNENDEKFLCVTLPVGLDNNDDDNINYYQVMNKINSTLKYVKAYMFHEGLWLSYERELFGDENLEQILYSMIVHLNVSLSFLRKAIESIDENNDDDTEMTNDEDFTNNKEDVA